MSLSLILIFFTIKAIRLVCLMQKFEFNFATLFTQPRSLSLTIRVNVICFVAVSQTGSISTKTGEWDVYEKDLPDTPAPPYIPERHFAGWSVENSRLKDDKEEDTSDDGSKDAKESNGKTARRLFKKEEKRRRRLLFC